MLKNRTLKTWSIILTGSLVAVGVSLFIFSTRSARAAGGTLIARSQLRRTADLSPRSAVGSVVTMIDSNGKETFLVNVTKLGQDNFTLFIRDEPSFTTNGVGGADLPPLARTGIKKGTWSRRLVGLGEAPPDFLPFVGDLTQLDNTSVDVSQPDIPSVTTIFTNIIAGTTNIVMGVTNIVGDVTNILDGIVIPNPGQTGLVFSTLWAPLYSLTTDLGARSYHRHGSLVAIGDASPNAVGMMNISFNGNSGRSELKIRASNLTPGQQYTLFIANTTNHNMTVMLPVDNMTQKNLGSTATFVRDTQFGDPLPKTGDPVPVQARDVGDLSGHIVQIRDAFDNVHLQGDMP
ncbi:MAG TPA: hypothetical protein VNL17_02070 [Verrucomicrobiae bacterium]|nr:hypothetical protein [Verrucomicrobiae bacterium]